MVYPKRVYAGAHKTNFTGSTIERSDLQIGAVRVWFDYLDNQAIIQHNKDPLNFGNNKAFRGSNIFTMDNVNIPSQELTVLNWDFDTVTQSDTSGQFYIEDITSGSSNNIYGWVDGIIRRENPGAGSSFPNSSTSFIENEFLYAQRKELPEISYTNDNINIKTDYDINFITDDDVSDSFYTIEKSMNQVVSEEMLKLFSSIQEFANLIGRPVDPYRMNYKRLDKVKQYFFERVQDIPDQEKFINYYKWIDASISNMVKQLVPLSVNYGEGVSDVVESHILERNKYRRKIGLTKTITSTETTMLGVNEATYNWQFGHAPLSGTEGNTNCVWQNQRRERIGTAAKDREQIRVVGINETNATASILATSKGTTYLGSTYVLRKLGRPYKFSVSFANEIHGGINYPKQKNRDFVDTVVYPHGRKGSSGQPLNIMAIGLGANNDGLIDKQDCLDILDPHKKTYYDAHVTVGKFASATGGPQTEEDAYQADIKSQLVWPFNILSGTMNSGYNKTTYSLFNENAVLVNLHSDTTDLTNEIPMQGPFTEAHVGGRQSRHVELNKYDPDLSKMIGGTKTPNDLQNEYTRPEEWRLLMGDNPSGDGAMGFVGPDYGGPYPDQTRKMAVYYRDGRTKRSVNIGNIHAGTGSSVLGNYEHNYQVLSTFSNQRHLLRNTVGLAGDGFYNPSGNFVNPLISPTIGDALPKTTQMFSLFGQAPGPLGNVWLPKEPRIQNKWSLSWTGSEYSQYEVSSMDTFERWSTSLWVKREQPVNTDTILDAIIEYRPASAPSKPSYVLQRDPVSSNPTYWQTGFVAYDKTTVNYKYWISSEQLQFGKWYHIAVYNKGITLNHEDITVYINGVSSSTSVGTSAGTPTTQYNDFNYMTIRNSNANMSALAQGPNYIDEVVFITGCIDQSEVTQLFNNRKWMDPKKIVMSPSGSEVKHWYRMGDGYWPERPTNPPDSLLDSMGNKNATFFVGSNQVKAQITGSVFNTLPNPILEESNRYPDPIEIYQEGQKATGSWTMYGSFSDLVPASGSFQISGAYYPGSAATSSFFMTSSYKRGTYATASFIVYSQKTRAFWPVYDPTDPGSYPKPWTEQPWGWERYNYASGLTLPCIPDAEIKWYSGHVPGTSLDKISYCFPPRTGETADAAIFNGKYGANRWFLLNNTNSAHKPDDLTWINSISSAINARVNEPAWGVTPFSDNGSWRVNSDFGKGKGWVWYTEDTYGVQNHTSSALVFSGTSSPPRTPWLESTHRDMYILQKVGSDVADGWYFALNLSGAENQMSASGVDRLTLMHGETTSSTTSNDPDFSYRIYIDCKQNIGRLTLETGWKYSNTKASSMGPWLKPSSSWYADVNLLELYKEKKKKKSMENDIMHIFAGRRLNPTNGVQPIATDVNFMIDGFVYTGSAGATYQTNMRAQPAGTLFGGTENQHAAHMTTEKVYLFSEPLGANPLHCTASNVAYFDTQAGFYNSSNEWQRFPDLFNAGFKRNLMAQFGVVPKPRSWWSFTGSLGTVSNGDLIGAASGTYAPNLDYPGGGVPFTASISASPAEIYTIASGGIPSEPKAIFEIVAQVTGTKGIIHTLGSNKYHWQYDPGYANALNFRYNIFYPTGSSWEEIGATSNITNQTQSWGGSDAHGIQPGSTIHFPNAKFPNKPWNYQAAGADEDSYCLMFHTGTATTVTDTTASIRCDATTDVDMWTDVKTSLESALGCGIRVIDFKQSWYELNPVHPLSGAWFNIEAKYTGSIFNNANPNLTTKQTVPLYPSSSVAALYTGGPYYFSASYVATGALAGGDGFTGSYPPMDYVRPWYDVSDPLYRTQYSSSLWMSSSYGGDYFFIPHSGGTTGKPAFYPAGKAWSAPYDSHPYYYIFDVTGSNLDWWRALKQKISSSTNDREKTAPLGGAFGVSNISLTASEVNTVSPLKKVIGPGTTMSDVKNNQYQSCIFELTSGFSAGPYSQPTNYSMSAWPSNINTTTPPSGNQQYSAIDPYIFDFRNNFFDATVGITGGVHAYGIPSGSILHFKNIAGTAISASFKFISGTDGPPYPSDVPCGNPSLYYIINSGTSEDMWDRFAAKVNTQNDFSCTWRYGAGSPAGGTGSYAVFSITASLQGTSSNGSLSASNEGIMNWSGFWDGTLMGPSGGTNEYYASIDTVGYVPYWNKTGSASRSTVTSRFSAPGGPEVNSRGYLNVTTGEYSAYNAVNYRNLGVRNNSGESGSIRVNSALNKREGNATLLTRPMGKFGTDSKWGKPIGISYPTVPATYKQPRNTSVGPKATGERLSRAIQAPSASNTMSDPRLYNTGLLGYENFGNNAFSISFWMYVDPFETSEVSYASTFCTVFNLYEKTQIELLMNSALNMVIRKNPSNGRYNIEFYTGPTDDNRWRLYQEDNPGSTLGFNLAGDATGVTPGVARWMFMTLVYRPSPNALTIKERGIVDLYINGRKNTAIDGTKFFVAPTSATTTSRISTINSINLLNTQFADREYFRTSTFTHSLPKELGGAIAEFAIWNRELTEAAVEELYSLEGIASAHPNQDALLDYWRLGEESVISPYKTHGIGDGYLSGTAFTTIDVPKIGSYIGANDLSFSSNRIKTKATGSVTFTGIPNNLDYFIINTGLPELTRVYMDLSQNSPYRSYSQPEIRVGCNDVKGNNDDLAIVVQNAINAAGNTWGNLLAVASGPTVNLTQQMSGTTYTGAGLLDVSNYASNNISKGNFYGGDRAGDPLSSSTGPYTVTTQEDKRSYDNMYVNSSIPRSDFQYAWITGSLAGKDLFKDQKLRGHANKDGLIFLEGDGGRRRFVAAINFPSASTLYGES